MFITFWIPQFKWQYVDWFIKRYPEYSKSKYNKMTKRQLEGKYCELRTKEG